jgi:hypothetical protein
MHRKDITSDDFRLLAQFCIALQKLLSRQAEPGACFYELGVSYLCLPVWYKSVSEWKIKHYKTFAIEAIGIELVDFRNITRYIGVKECQLIDLLFRFSMLGIVPESHIGRTKPKFRMPFTGTRLLSDGTPRCYVFGHEGFVIEKRRAMGGFK